MGRTGESRSAYRIQAEKPEPKKAIGRLNLLAPELFFLILAHPVYKM